ncbi:retrotransposon protein [Panicum miliaceum]|uniref:Retrotransposon protein n=1 Tax=Panicum miliaceum TaxID=4540 RepID=A0A3L6Q5H9_PANMI|nr:retrotransposon protein [Panicum miliaceum]
MVNVINVISEGSNEPVHEMKRQQKDYLRAANHVCEGKHFRTPWSHVPITFIEANLKLKHYPHNDLLVIRANIGKNTVHFFDNDVGRILVDNGSFADTILWWCFVQMGFTEKDLKKSTYLLIGFDGKKIKAVEKADINVTFGERATMRTEVTTFDIVDIQYVYNAIFGRNIFGRNTIIKFVAVIHC